MSRSGPALQKDRHLVAEGNVDVARSLHHLAVRRNEPQTIHRVGDRNVAHLVILIADHRTEVTFVRKLYGFDPEARPEDPIEGGRWAAALQMSEHTRPRFFSSAFGDFARNHVANSAQSKFAAFNVACNLLPIFRARAFGYDNERAESSRGFSPFYCLSNFVVIKRNLRNQNDVGAARNPAMQRYPASVTSHHFDNHHPFVTRCCGVQTIKRVHHFRHSRIESERHRRRFDVVVDRFRDTDAIDARFLHLHGRRHRTVPADDDERFDAEFVQNFFRARDDFARDDCTITGADFGDKMTAVGRSDDCSAQRHDAFSAFAIEHDVIARRQQTFEAVAESNYFPAEFFAGEDDTPQYSVESGTIPAAGENANTRLHGEDTIKAFFSDRQAVRWRPTDRRVASLGQ